MIDREATGTHVRRVVAALVGLVCLIGASLGQQEVKPFFDGRSSSHRYNGPERDDPGPPGLKEIRIGYFGPYDPDHPVHGDPWTAARMAVDDLNAEGGYDGLPFRLLPAWSENPWGSGVSEIARMVYAEGIVALIGGVDGPTAHLAEQIVAKARLPLVNPASSDRTANMAHVPWIFSCLPGEDLQMNALLQVMESRDQSGPIILVSATDHDSRALTGEFLESVSKRGKALRLHANVTAGEEPELSNLTPDLLSLSPQPSFVILADPLVSARVARHLAEFYSGPVFGSSAMARSPFQAAVADLAIRFIFPLPAEPESLERFSERFRLMTGRSADFAAAQTYDAVQLLGSAIRRAGVNRARVGDALRAASPWSGTAGAIAWDMTGQNTRPVTIVQLEGNRITRYEP